MLLGNAHVKRAVGELLGEFSKASRAGHSSSDGDDILALFCRFDEVLGEHLGPSGLGGLERLASDGINHTGGMHLIRNVVLSRGKALALLGHGVHDDRSAVILGITQGVLHLLQVMAIYRADVLDAQLGEHLVRNDGVLHALLQAVHDLEHAVPDPPHVAERILAGVHDLVIGRLQT